MNTMNRRGDSTLPCATPVSKVMVAFWSEFGFMRTVECLYMASSRSTSGMLKALIIAHSAGCDIAL